MFCFPHDKMHSIIASSRLHVQLVLKSLCRFMLSYMSMEGCIPECTSSKDFIAKTDLVCTEQTE